MNYYKNIEYYLNLTRQERRNVNAELKRYPSGRLIVSKEKKGIRYYYSFESKGERTVKRVNHDMDLVTKLARKAYLLGYRDRLDRCAEALEKCAESLKPEETGTAEEYLPANYDLLPREFILGPAVIACRLSPVEDNSVRCCSPARCITGITPAEWMQIPYRINTYKADEKIHKSSCGLPMRSKGEIAWAERLLHYGVAFHYDELLFFNGEWISPDFIVMRKDGKLIYIEHCGLMADEKYLSRHKHKLNTYEAAGIVPWDNLIVTYDRPDGSIDMELIDAEIKSKILI